MKSISAVIIVKNEEKNIERCLKSLDWTDEIILVDTGSEDNTVEIAKQFNVKIFHLEKWEGFGKAKKYATEMAENDWILSIDADEEVTEGLLIKIKKILENPTKDCYRIKRNSFYLGKLIKHSGWNKDYPKRLFNRKFANFNEKLVHESVVCKTEIGTIEQPILHYTYPTVSSHLRKIDLYTELAAQERKTKKSSIFMAIALGLNKFINIYFFKKGFLDGSKGLLLAIFSAFSVFVKYIKFYEKSNRTK